MEEKPHIIKLRALEALIRHRNELVERLEEISNNAESHPIDVVVYKLALFEVDILSDSKDISVTDLLQNSFHMKVLDNRTEILTNLLEALSHRPEYGGLIIPPEGSILIESLAYLAISYHAKLKAMAGNSSNN